MKKTDIAMVVLIAATSVFIAFFIAQAIFGNAGQRKTTIKTTDRIESSITMPSADIFNTNAINPAVPVQIKGTDSTSGSQ
jgi:hypothetical protein